MRRLRVRRTRELLLRGDDALRGGNSLGFLATDGALFDPARDERFYQTTSGILLSGAADPVGLMLDDKFGGALGPELVDIDNLPTPTINNVGGCVGAWDAATRTMSNTVTGTNQFNPRFRFELGLTPGRRYFVTGLLSGDISDGISPSEGSRIRLATAGADNGIGFNTSTGVIEGRQVSADTNLDISLNGTRTAPTNVTIEELSIREILGAHASQATTANRPTRVLTGDVWGLEFDGSNDRLEGDAAMRDIFRNCEAGFFACVVEHVALGGKYIASWSTNGSTANQRFGLKASATGELIAEVRRADADTTASTTSAAGVITTSKQLVMAVLNYAAGTVDLYVGNPVTPAQSGSMPAGSGASANTASDAMRLGCKSDGSEFLSGRLHGPIVIGRIAPSAAQRQAIFSRLSTITGAPLS
jgi:hypothetical protein